MTTKVDLSKLMQDAEEKSSTEHKKPLADKHNERTPASISNVAIRRTTKSMKSSSASLLPLVLLIAVLSSLIFYTFRLEMRVRKLEQDLGSHVALHKALSEAAAETAQSPTPKPADAAASATPPPEVTGATERSSPSPLTFVENKGTPHDWMIEAINEIGSGSEVVAVYSSEVGDLEDELFDDELRNEDTFSDGLDESFDSYNEWSGDGLPSTESSSSDSETFSESLGSYLDLFGYRSNGLSVPSAVAHERRRRSAAGMQPGDEPLAEQRTGNNDGEFADDDIMMADDAPPQPSSSAGSNERRTPRGRQREGTGSSATHEEQPKGRNTEVRNETSSRKASAAGPPATGRLAASEESRQSRNRQSRTQYVKQVSRNQPPTSAKAAARTLSSGTGIKVAHFVAPKQISHYVTDKMPPVTFPFWRVDNWTTSLGSQNRFFDLSDGKVTILESGVYLIYAQIVYHDVSGRWAFGIYVDDSERLKCMNSEQLHRRHNEGAAGSQEPTSASAVHSVYQHCYTSGLLKLQRFDKISLRCLYGNKAIVMQPGFTFWGLVKLVSTDD